MEGSSLLPSFHLQSRSVAPRDAATGELIQFNHCVAALPFLNIQCPPAPLRSARSPPPCPALRSALPCLLHGARGLLDVGKVPTSALDAPPHPNCNTHYSQ